MITRVCTKGKQRVSQRRRCQDSSRSGERMGGRRFENAAGFEVGARGHESRIEGGLQKERSPTRTVSLRLLTSRTIR